MVQIFSAQSGGLAIQQMMGDTGFSAADSDKAVRPLVYHCTWKLAPSNLGVEGPWEEGISESWMVRPFLEELMWASDFWVTLLRVFLFVNAYKPTVYFVQHDKPACFPSLF